MFFLHYSLVVCLIVVKLKVKTVTLIPYPQQLTSKPGTFVIDNSTKVVANEMLLANEIEQLAVLLEIDLRKTPSKASEVKFLKTRETKTILNKELIDKTTRLLGVKGYYTDIAQSVANNNMIIEQYHDL